MHLILTCSLFILNYLIITMNEQTTIPITIENEWQSRLLSADGATTEKITVYSLEEEKEVTYIKTDKFGDDAQGGQSVMYNGYKEGKEGNKVAIKEITLQTQRQVDAFINEVEIMTKLKFGEVKHAIQIIGHTSTQELHLDHKAYIIMPKFDGDLFTYLAKVRSCIRGGRFNTEKTALNIIPKIMDIAEPLEYLSAHHIIHHDIKTENILVNWNKDTMEITDIALSDLGSSQDYTGESPIKYREPTNKGAFNGTPIVASWPIWYEHFGKMKEGKEKYGMDDLNLTVDHLDIENFINVLFRIYAQICPQTVSHQKKQGMVRNELCTAARQVFEIKKFDHIGILTALRQRRNKIMDLANAQKETYTNETEIIRKLFASFAKYAYRHETPVTKESKNTYSSALIESTKDGEVWNKLKEDTRIALA